MESSSHVAHEGVAGANTRNVKKGKLRRPTERFTEICSSIAIDQGHEQLNMLKGTEGVIGPLQYPQSHIRSSLYWSTLNNLITSLVFKGSLYNVAER